MDVKKTHLDARYDDEEWVELPEEFSQYGHVPDERNGCTARGEGVAEEG